MPRRKFSDIFIENILNVLYEEKRVNSSLFQADSSPTHFELLVKKAINTVLEGNQFECDVSYKKGGHSFPDIVCRFPNDLSIGIEVKSSTQLQSPDDNWSTLGNSIKATTRVPVDYLYIVFIKVNMNGSFFKSRRFEECVSDIVATHYPRYMLDLNLNAGESFFDLSGIKYDELNESNDPVGLVSQYFIDKGETLWWISDSSPAVIQTWDEISSDLKQEIMSKAFVLFPELIFSSSSNKYKNLAKWLVAKYSVVDSSLRDRFSAGGTVTIILNNKCFEDMPKVYHKLISHLDSIRTQIGEIEQSDLIRYWTDYQIALDEYSYRVNFWYDLITSGLESTKKRDELEFMKELIIEINRPELF